MRCRLPNNKPLNARAFQKRLAKLRQDMPTEKELEALPENVREMVVGSIKANNEVIDDSIKCVQPLADADL